MNNKIEVLERRYEVLMAQAEAMDDSCSLALGLSYLREARDIKSQLERLELNAELERMNSNASN